MSGHEVCPSCAVLNSHAEMVTCSACGWKWRPADITDPVRHVDIAALIRRYNRR